ncbi:MAG: group II intron reverse transcriptase/maturase [Vulcanimicrobiaceae bacterium]
MMYGRDQSDVPVVAMKSANNAERSAAESMEPRGATKGKATTSTTRRPQDRGSVSPGLDRLRQFVRKNRKARLTTLLHHVDVGLLRWSYLSLKRDAAAGVDGQTWRAYGESLEERLVDLHGRVHRGAHRALPSRRRMIPKPDGRERPLGIASIEDKIVQRAIVEVLNVIYEEEFLGFSYGFRPGRSQHDALDALWVGISNTPVNWIVDADIRSFFDTVDHDWLMRFVEHRIADRRIQRLIRKWLKSGVLEGTVLTASEVGTPQGAVISPLLANIVLHYVFDLWVQQWRCRHAHGNVIVVRYADDLVAGFEQEDDAKAFLAELRIRFEAFGLSLHPEKTRLIEFGRHATDDRSTRGLGKPETFTFLGFIHICGKSKRGKFLLWRKSPGDRMRAKLKAIKTDLRRKMHETTGVQGRWLRAVVMGYFNYHAVPTNTDALAAFRFQVLMLWHRTLRRRSQKDRTLLAKTVRLGEQWLPMPRVLHPWPNQRFAVKYPRWEPSARIAPAGI